MEKLRIVEMYAGTGRSVQPFLERKLCSDPVLIDINPYASEVYKHNFPNASYHIADLEKKSSSDILDMAGEEIDVLLGCPPCQGYSDNGPRRPDDPRNIHITLFSDFIKKIRPKAVVMENVPLLAESDRFSRFVRVVEGAGYSWTASIVNAALWGSCQSRQRLIFIGIRKDAGADPQFPFPSHGGGGLYFNYGQSRMCRLKDDLIGMLGRTPGTLRSSKMLPHLMEGKLGKKRVPNVWDAIGDLPSAESARAELNHFPWAHTKEMLKRMRNVSEGGRWSGGQDHFSQAYGRLHRRGLARTITGYFANPGSGRYWHPVENRALSLREAARIQGFPDSFKFLERQNQNCMLVGNALDSSLARLACDIIVKGISS